MPHTFAGKPEHPCSKCREPAAGPVKLLGIGNRQAIGAICRENPLDSGRQDVVQVALAEGIRDLPGRYGNHELGHSRLGRYPALPGCQNEIRHDRDASLNSDLYKLADRRLAACSATPENSVMLSGRKEWG